MTQQQLQNYAKLIAVKGLNVQDGQEVWINAELDQPEFVTMVVEECYKAGAAKVVVDWSHQPVSKLNATYRSLETISAVAEWEKAKMQYQVDKIPCRLHIESSDPDGMKGIDQEKMRKASLATYPIIKPYRDQLENKYQWCIVAVPGKAWAKKIFPDLPVEDAMEKLWDAILMTARADGEDPCKAWDEHNENLKKRCDYINSLHLASLEYRSSNGTDFKVGLIDEGRFCGGGETSLQSIFFNPNIPSEEIFTSPKAGVAEGIVYSTKPLSYRGELIENFSVRFENGKVVEVKAEKGEELLKQMVSMDEGASMLGECALIAYDSPINNTGILFFNTLFDENASCHLALGRGFHDCITDFEKYTQEDFTKMGVNESMIHVDFMIGSEDMEIVGVQKDGTRVQLFKNGNWAF
ncbi:MAG: aminopeptidase [Clostridia bacterium]|nr:aminopeptidase [Clostridia bacterium]